jgi:hypothetical protein
MAVLGSVLAAPAPVSACSIQATTFETDNWFAASRGGPAYVPPAVDRPDARWGNAQVVAVGTMVVNLGSDQSFSSTRARFSIEHVARGEVEESAVVHVPPVGISNTTPPPIGVGRRYLILGRGGDDELWATSVTEMQDEDAAGGIEWRAPNPSATRIWGVRVTAIMWWSLPLVFLTVVLGTRRYVSGRGARSQ